MKDIMVRVAAAAGACAVVTGVAIGLASEPSGQSPTVLAKPALPTTAVTNVSRSEVAPSEPSIEKAKPQITGPAQLPAEDQGLPGN